MDIVDLVRRCIRMIYIARKPTAQEFETVAKVTALGMVSFGLLGLVLSLVLSSF